MATVDDPNDSFRFTVLGGDPNSNAVAPTRGTGTITFGPPKDTVTASLSLATGTPATMQYVSEGAHTPLLAMLTRVQASLKSLSRHEFAVLLGMSDEGVSGEWHAFDRNAVQYLTTSGRKHADAVLAAAMAKHAEAT